MKLKLDLEEQDYAYEGWAFMLFHTSVPNYIFADSLNGLYGYRLSRIDDMVLDGSSWPLYRFDDSLHRRLIVFLAERPADAADAPWEAGDMLLVIKGENAASEAEAIYDDFTSSKRCEEGDLLASEHRERLQDLLAGFTMAFVLDFDDSGLSRKAQKEQALIRQHCDLILNYIEEQHLDLGDDIRRRIEQEKSFKALKNL